VGAAFFQHDFASFAAVSEDAVTGWSRFLHTSRGWTRPVPPAVVLVQNCALGTVTAKSTAERLLVVSLVRAYG